MWRTPAELHAALNDLPVVLLIFSLFFDIAGGLTKRESLRATGFWTLVAGAGGALLALLSGLRAEDTIEHGGSVHLVMERHETLAITVTIVFGLLAAWRILRKDTMGRRERPAYLTAMVISGLLLFWTAHVGGTIVFRHGGGVPTEVLTGALAERAAGHTHDPGEEDDDDHDHSESAAGDSTGEGGHTDPSGTPLHQH
ncbi:MAG: DUF2231 domain-containing protein [Gemmatimonadales bacterium]